VRVADGDGFTFFARFLEGQFQLPANSAGFLNIIEKWHIPKSTTNTCRLGLLIGCGGSGSAAINKEKMVGTEEWHKVGHELRVRGGQ